MEIITNGEETIIQGFEHSNTGRLILSHLHEHNTTTTTHIIGKYTWEKGIDCNQNRKGRWKVLTLSIIRCEEKEKKILYIFKLPKTVIEKMDYHWRRGWKGSSGQEQLFFDWSIRQTSIIVKHNTTVLLYEENPAVEVKEEYNTTTLELNVCILLSYKLNILQIKLGSRPTKREYNIVGESKAKTHSRWALLGFLSSL